MDFRLCYGGDTVLFRPCLAIEQLYVTRNRMFIGPLSFSQGLLKWAFCGSKAAYALDGSTTASGSISSLRNVLKASSHDPNTCFDVGDVEVFADNTQRKGKTSRVKEDGTTPLNIVTNVVFIQSNPYTSLQSNTELSPAKWLIDDEDSSCKIKDFGDKLNSEVFRVYRQNTHKVLMQEVCSEVRYTDTSTYDHVTLAIENTDSSKSVCPKDLRVFSLSK